MFQEDYSHIYAFVLLVFLLTSGITWGLIGYIYDDKYNLDRLLVILFNTTNVLIVTSVVEPERLKKMFRPVYLLLIPVYVAVALSFRYAGIVLTNVTLNFRERIGMVSLLILVILFLALCFHFSYHFLRYKKNKIGLIYFAMYLALWVLFIGTSTVAYFESQPLHLHHYALALMLSYGFTANHSFFILGFVVCLAVMNEGITTWGADLLYQQKPNVFYFVDENNTAMSYTRMNCVSSTPFRFNFWGHRHDYDHVSCSFSGLTK